MIKYNQNNMGYILKGRLLVMGKWARLQFTPGTPLGKDGKRLTACREHILLSKEAAKEGMVLLKNNENCLPLTKGKRVALFGKGTFDYVKGGGGSGDVTVSYIRNLYEGFKELGNYPICEEVAEYYKKEVEKQYANGREPGMIKEVELTDKLINTAKAFTDTAIISISRFSGEGWDRKSSYDKTDRDAECGDLGPSSTGGDIFEKGDFYLSAAEQNMVDKVVDSFSTVIVVLNVGGMIDTKWFRDNDKIKSVLLAWQGGMEGGLAAAELLTGYGCPSGKLVDTFAAQLEDYPSAKGFHESDAYVEYTEDIYVGYRYFETIPGASDKVVYPFGYGLSYTEFELSKPVISMRDNNFLVSVDVSNVGKYAGKQVVQAYASAPQGKLGKSEKVLVAFAKTDLLSPGETRTVHMSFSEYQLASYDDLGKVCESAYILEKGEYRFYVGTSVRDCEENGYKYMVAEDKVVSQLTKKMSPTQLKKRMCSDGSYEELPTTFPVDTDENILVRIDDDLIDGMMPSVEPQKGWQQWSHNHKVHLFEEVASGDITMEQFMEQLSDRQLIHLLGGQPNTGVADTFGYGNIPEYGIPSVMTADGPAGLRIRPDREVCTTAWPCATLLACSWNEDIVEQVGAAGGVEVKENNIGFWLTPAVNIHRCPLCGRNFEYYSEDPLVAGKMGAAMVRGIQSNRVGVSVKHFALNNKETNRKNSDSRASERAIREIYLKPFEIIVNESDPWTVMSSYNIINGHRASECKELLVDILRDEWGFEGFVTTDWWNMAEHYKELLAGNDIKMGCGYPDRLEEALDKGAISREDLERSVKRLFNILLKLD